ncbi:hypothetical protein PORCAN_943 [Porphyromonas crevioricanis JCM 13913]|nr:hypothetical protein PORCAN_943 [Porphyromonas crevioricanis JCM 13913]
MLAKNISYGDQKRRKNTIKIALIRVEKSAFLCKWKNIEINRMRHIERDSFGL